MASPQAGESSTKRLEDLLDLASTTAGTGAVLRRAGSLAGVRLGSTRGRLLTTRALLFALGFADSDRTGPSLQRVLFDDLTLDFSSFVQAMPEFERTLERSFDLKRLGSADGPDDELERIRKMKVSRNLTRVLERAASTARRLDQPDVRAEHMLFALLIEEGTRAREILETTGAPPARVCAHLMKALSDKKSGPAIEMWRALLEEAAGLDRGSTSTGDAGSPKKTAKKKATKKKAAREPLAVRTLKPGSDIERRLASESRDADNSEAAAYDGEATPSSVLLEHVASALDQPAAIVLRRARKWARYQRGYEAPVLTPAILLVAMIESYRTEAQRNWGHSASVWALAAERVLAEELRYHGWRGEVMEASFEPHTTLRPGETIADALDGPRSEALDSLLGTALVLRNKGFWSEDLGLDHLFAAMMSRTDLPSRSALERLDVATDAGVAAIVRGIRQSSERELWRAYLADAFQSSTQGPIGPAALIAARFSSDSPDADDLMDVEDEARSFARYIAKEGLDTPLAIGLFGDWGTGKSFFMNRLRRFVGQLAGRGESWCKDIVQIEFNAWHYIESNLWASLVEHILTELESWSKSRNREDEIKALFEQFESAREVERESDEELQRAKGARDDAESELDEARAALASRINEERQLSVDVLWKSIQSHFWCRVERDEKLKAKLDDASATLGLPLLSSSARALNDALEQAKATGGRARLMVCSLLARDRGGWQWASLVALVAVVPFAAGAGWSWLAAISDVPARIGAGVAELSGLLSVLAAWAGHGLATANKALQDLESVRDNIESIVRERTGEHERALAEAQARVATATERVEKAEARLSGARQRVDEARRALEAETPRGRLTRFLEMRLENADYAQHLGVVSMIRRDFELLSGIMTGRDWSSENARRLEEAGIDPENLRTFDRIVLYIDDLDRCPAQRVVEVLQAVHLLLAFPLFVVVVGVDARWVSQSLALHYPHLLDESAVERARIDGAPGSRRESDRLIASSHDYLEKIFQVPYWVKPMDATASAWFLEGLARQSLPVREEDDVGADATGQQAARESAVHPAGAARSEKAEPVGPATLETRSNSTGHPESTRPGVADETEAPSSTMASAAEEPVPPLRTDVPVLADLPLSEHEIAFMSALAPSVGRSPRRAKRFFNVYQLIRASLSAEERDGFVGGRGQALDYRVVMGLLAVVTGAPGVAPRVFDALLDGAATGDTIASIRKRWDHERSFAQSDDWWRVEKVLDRLEEIGGDGETLDRLRHWMRRAMRFSFTSCLPGEVQR